MDYLQAAILSVVEGLTEFLPISSTGHLVLASELLKIKQTEFVKSFEVIIQLGAILAVVFLYWKTLLKGVEIWKRIIVAFIPTAVLGLVFYKVIKGSLIGNPTITLWALFVGGIALILIEKLYIAKRYKRHDEIASDYKEKDHDLESIERLSLQKTVLIGLFQSISMIPGVSRAAATIFGGLFMGLKRRAAVEFSFLIAIPTMAGATGLDLLKSDFSFSSNEWGLLGIGFIGAFLTAILAVKFFVKYVEKNNLIVFGVYRILLALLFWIFII